MDDIWIISWFYRTAFDANPIWKSPMYDTHHASHLIAAACVNVLHSYQEKP